MTQGDTLAHFLGGLVLLCAFLLLSQRRLAAMISLYRAQALILSAAAFWQGYSQHSAELFLTGGITLSFNAILLPRTLRRIVHRLNLIGAVETALPAGVLMLLGVALIGIAARAVPPVTASSVNLISEDLAPALSVVLLGFLMITTWRNAAAQVIGFLSTENGLMLAAIGLPGMPVVAGLSLALLVLTVFLVLGVFIFRMREDFDRPDRAGIAEIERFWR